MEMEFNARIFARTIETNSSYDNKTSRSNLVGFWFSFTIRINIKRTDESYHTENIGYEVPVKLYYDIKTEKFKDDEISFPTMNVSFTAICEKTLGIINDLVKTEKELYKTFINKYIKLYTKNADIWNPRRSSK